MTDGHPTQTATTRQSPPRTAAARTAARHVDDAEHLVITLPLVGTVRLPPAQQLTYYAAVGTLLALEIIDWPIAFLVTAGHALSSQHHNRAIQEFGEGLAEASD